MQFAKKSLSILLVCLMLLTSAYISCTIPDIFTVSSDAAVYGDYEYTVSGKNATITAYKGKALNVAIPETLGGYKVTAIGSDVFAETKIKAVVIPDGVTKIGKCSFYGCEDLTTVILPGTLKSLGYFTFNMSGNIKDVVFVGTEAEWNAVDTGTENDTLTVDADIYFSDAEKGACGVADTVYWALKDGRLNIIGFGEMTEYDSIWGAPWRNDVKNITSTYISEGITSIAPYCFYDCENMTSVNIPDSVTKIGYEAFYECSGITSLTIPAAVKSVGENAFAFMGSLNSISVKKGNTHYYVSGNCLIEKATGILIRGIDSSVIPTDGSIKEIADYAFNNCAGLKTLVIPASAKEIGYHAFDGCSGLTSITVEKGNPNYFSSGNCLVHKLSGEVNRGCCNSVLPEDGTVFKIGYRAFDSAYGLKTLKIPYGVTDIAESAFADCKDLKTLTIPATVTKISMVAFEGCEAITDIYFSGTQEQWFNAFYEEEYDDYLENVNMHYNVDCYDDPEPLVATRVSLSSTSGTYTGKAKNPDVTVKNSKGKTLTEGINFTVTYCCEGGCRNVGTHTVTVTGKGIYCETVKKTFKITKQALSVSRMSLSYASCTYTGSAKKPTVTVKNYNKKTLKSGTDYTVKYCCSGGCKKVGKHTVTVTGKGNYSGTKTLTFKINPKATTISKVTSPKKATATVTVKKQATQTTGYEIQYSTSSKFTTKTTKTVKITSPKTLAKTITKLSSGKNYYFRVRTYKTVSKVNYTSAWSKSVKVKIK